MNELNKEYSQYLLIMRIAVERGNREVGFPIGYHDSISKYCQVVASKDRCIQLYNPIKRLDILCPLVQQGLKLNVVCHGKLRQVLIENSGAGQLTDDCFITGQNDNQFVCTQ